MNHVNNIVVIYLHHSRMDALEALNSAAEDHPYMSFSDIDAGRYVVHQFTVVKTKHGKRVRVDMEKFYMYLPERYIGVLNADKIDKLNENLKVMVYRGKDSKRQDR